MIIIINLMGDEEDIISCEDDSEKKAQVAQDKKLREDWERGQIRREPQPQVVPA